MCELSCYESDCPEAMTIIDRNKRPPKKVVWYFPIIPHLKRLFVNEKTAELMRWHAEKRVNDGKLRHLADGSQRKLKCPKTLMKHPLSLAVSYGVHVPARYANHMEGSRQSNIEKTLYMCTITCTLMHIIRCAYRRCNNSGFS